MIPDYVNKNKIMQKIEKFLEPLNLPFKLFNFLNQASLDKLIDLLERLEKNPKRNLNQLLNLLKNVGIQLSQSLIDLLKLFQKLWNITKKKVSYLLDDRLVQFLRNLQAEPIQRLFDHLQSTKKKDISEHQTDFIKDLE